MLVNPDSAVRLVRNYATYQVDEAGGHDVRMDFRGHDGEEDATSSFFSVVSAEVNSPVAASCASSIFCNVISAEVHSSVAASCSQADMKRRPLVEVDGSYLPVDGRYHWSAAVFVNMCDKIEAFKILRSEKFARREQTKYSTIYWADYGSRSGLSHPMVQENARVLIATLNNLKYLTIDTLMEASYFMDIVIVNWCATQQGSNSLTCRGHVVHNLLLPERCVWGHLFEP